MHIEVYSDMVCPWCRIGKKNLTDAIAQWNAQGGEPITLTFRAFQLDPSLPPEGRPFKDVMTAKMGGESRLQQAIAHVTNAGAAVNVTFRFDRVKRMPNTMLAHRFVALLPDYLKNGAIDALFLANFEEGRDIAQLSEIETIAAGLGPEAEAALDRLRQGEGENEVNADLAHAAKIGVTGVPFFIFNNKYALSGAYPADKLVQLMDRVTKPED